MGFFESRKEKVNKLLKTIVFRMRSSILVITVTGSFAQQNYYEYLLVTEIQGEGEQYLPERKIMALTLTGKK